MELAAHRGDLHRSLSFFFGIFAAYYIAKLPRLLKGVLDVVLTLPLVLPPTVVGYLLCGCLGRSASSAHGCSRTFGLKLVMTWWSAIFATTVVIFPLMYRTVRGAFEAFDETLAYSGQTLGLSNTFIFWRIRIPYCRQGVLAGTVLAFARALGEYGATSMIAGYTPGKTATISTTVYQMWQNGQRRTGVPVGHGEHRYFRACCWRSICLSGEMPAAERSVRDGAVCRY